MEGKTYAVVSAAGQIGCPALCLSIGIFVSYTSFLGLPQVFSETNICIYMFTPYSPGDTGYTSSLLYFAYTWFNQKVVFMGMKRLGINIHGCGRRIWKVDCGWDLSIDQLSKQVSQQITLWFNLFSTGKSANQKMLLTKSLNLTLRNYQMKPVQTPSMELLLLVHPAR